MKRFVFYALDQYTLKVYRRKEWEAGVKHGIKCEQQRIIKLLEDLSNPKIPMGQLHIPGYQMREVIALIKGEK